MLTAEELESAAIELCKLMNIDVTNEALKASKKMIQLHINIEKAIMRGKENCESIKSNNRR